MIRQTPPHRHAFAVVLIVGLSTLTGCTTLKLSSSSFSFGKEESNYKVGELQLEPSASEKVYRAVQQSRSQNAIVLQILGDSSPVRVLPLPPGESSVFVSDLLKQSGVTKKLGSIEATLFRNSSEAIGGIPMEVKMGPDGRSVRPESDYALRAGDRLRVQEAPSPAMKSLVNALLGL